MPTVWTTLYRESFWSVIKRYSRCRHGNCMTINAFQTLQCAQAWPKVLTNSRLNSIVMAKPSSIFMERIGGSLLHGCKLTTLTYDDCRSGMRPGVVCPLAAEAGSHGRMHHSRVQRITRSLRRTLLVRMRTLFPIIVCVFLMSMSASCQNYEKS